MLTVLCVCVCFQAQIAFLQGERKGQENLKKDLVRRIKMLEYALKQERYEHISHSLTTPVAMFVKATACNLLLLLKMRKYHGKIDKIIICSRAAVSHPDFPVTKKSLVKGHWFGLLATAEKRSYVF